MTPAVAAYGYVSVIASNLHLISFVHYISFGVNTGVYDGFASASAGRFYFVDGVGYLKQAA